MKKTRKASIWATGSYLPEKILSNSDLEQMVDTSDEWIVTRTGIKERRIAAVGEYTSIMGAKAAEKAIQKAGLTKDQIECIIFSTSAPDHIFPSSAALAQAYLGVKEIPAFDCMAACTGYLYGLSVAKAFIESGMYNNVLLIAADKLSSFVNYEDRNTCVLFGDGGSACVIGESRPGALEITNVNLGADGSVADLLSLPAGGSRIPASIETVTEGKHFIAMEGKEVFKHAVRRMEFAAKACIAEAGLGEDDIDWLVPHQANERIIDAIAKRFKIDDAKVFKTLSRYGNTAASSVCIALDELLQSHVINSGEYLLLVAFGGGLSWGAVVLQQVEG
ncbi:3-oxoacyl-[acyl-carrier-protein] synthase 3,3-oxoacyl-(acyl carrier protein) synthase III,3-oxoacyl-[acyl-carrier-protein] synthase III,3-oxoacyl-[acyl-carrier-protein] synthase III,3-Oxoacyl-[acyl-carrier-protein (ACP)] synthase III C terminal [Chlamydia poikilotherma]|uniref:Beta-ketoacyl-[acyl-carrier-protein] synthase III n=1 Tax=Chlamydia poikilotherma TaxID=1967783 RepID=A0A3B0Q7P3_9CHLA|nr:beta-ketoacyl-ACP synthase III [Chlamydia poikilotherma]SYX08967.1 3-oxoacyl-[acyl-carrier-protein] synthase 3,3-oxoacyl-(acyl carrier protein) synthase III,3-oxoacyl-[acyl-carrier-protein] synthase III,3-oxoacyl-[acyl-carrier-protein] synthase III,3-Oxoacyl-[acyl-carrier-protein (ACP)] synthase III C terminal [Chlamydia poikilotherma]